jgi:hypothetical protein
MHIACPIRCDLASQLPTVGKPNLLIRENEMTTTKRFNYVSRDGYALDEYGHEVIGDNGKPIVVPEDERADYDLGYRPHETPTNDE